MNIYWVLHIFAWLSFLPLSHCYHQVCDNLFNGSFDKEQKAVQEVVAEVEMYSSLLKQVTLSAQPTKIHINNIIIMNTLIIITITFVIIIFTTTIISLTPYSSPSSQSMSDSCCHHRSLHRPLEWQGWQEAPHPLTFLWLLPSMCRPPPQHLLFPRALRWISLAGKRLFFFRLLGCSLHGLLQPPG